MADDLPRPPGSGDPDGRPGEGTTEPPGGHGQPPPAPPGGYQQPGGYPTAPGQPPGGYPGPPGQYGQYGYGPGGYYPPVAQTEPSATAALVIAIAGFFICAPVGAIVAWVLANSAEKKIQASGGRLTGLDQARAARIIAIVELVLTGLVLLFGILLVFGAVGARQSYNFG
jgi:hypothetical protein